MRSRLGQLSCLIALAEDGQMSRAARSIDVTPAVMSRAISQLETEVGVPLVARESRRATLTAAGAAFAAKARAAFAAETEAVQTAAALGRAARGTVLVGFIGPPPSIGSPALFERITESQDGATMSFQDLSFPLGATSSWLAAVDVALCHRPRQEDGVATLPLRVEPRAVLANRKNPIAARDRVAVEDVLDEVFIGYHPDVQPEWVAFHSLDDYRGGPPEKVTADGVTTTMQMAATIAASRAVTTVPYGDARIASALMPDIVALPLPDAAPAVISIVWREDNVNPLVKGLLDAARALDAPGDGV
jgi:DNA-binding transcriptional LysR family regulator